MANTTGKKFGGRQKGTTNKKTEKAREAIAAFVDGNAGRLNNLLDRIEEENGAKDAFNAITSLLEYHMPKLQRTDHIGDVKHEIKGTVTIRFKE